LFDVATSTVAGGKLRLAERAGSTLLPRWIADLDGVPNEAETPVQDPKDFYLLPLGGTREQGSHKGYGFAMMAEIMATLLSGATPDMLDPGGGPRHYFAAYNIDAFTDVEAFKDTMDRTLRTLRSTRPAPGHDRVLYPRLAEFEDTQDRRADGIPPHRDAVQWFEDISAELSLPPLERL
jgi:LDH2 family malate/lactate/ureidoglycolate dehydrogenase